MITAFGEFLQKRSVNKAELGRKAGLTRLRISQLSTREGALLRFDEAYAIAKAMGMDLNELAKELGYEPLK